MTPEDRHFRLYDRLDFWMAWRPRGQWLQRFQWWNINRIVRQVEREP